MSAPDPARRSAGPDDGLAPDPSFWGPEDRPARPRRPRPGRRDTPSLRFGPRSDGRAVVAIAAVLAVTAALISLRAVTPVATPPPISSAATVATTTPTGGTTGRVVVHVAGAVTRPGVVTLPTGDRVVDALDAAGGALAAADLNQLNLAARLRDGEQVLVPTSVPAPTTTTTTTVTIPLPATTPPG
jgi:competence protein ComEA